MMLFSVMFENFTVHSELNQIRNIYPQKMTMRYTVFLKVCSTSTYETILIHIDICSLTIYSFQ